MIWLWLVIKNYWCNKNQDLFVQGRVFLIKKDMNEEIFIVKDVLTMTYFSCVKKFVIFIFVKQFLLEIEFDRSFYNRDMSIYGIEYGKSIAL